MLAKYINQYTARNTRDYFIHKDLGGFLKRELDFYIKNEVMRLDDIENAEAPVVESYLAKIKVIRKIATKLIDFLAQLEDFQKKLWLKKKFVTETNYCITLDRVPEDLYGEIAANDAQRKEWVDYFSIDEIGAPNEVKNAKSKDLFEKEKISYTVPLTVEFLKANDKLVLDTSFFTDAFKAKLIESIDNFDEQCDGLLIHSENFQALNLLQERYREQVKCVYIDPPYNTGNDSDFYYKDAYRYASWITMIQDRLSSAIPILNNRGSLFCQIDDYEEHHLRMVLDSMFGEENRINRIAWVRTFNSGSSKGLSRKLPANLDTIYWYAKTHNFEHKKELREYSEGAMKRYDKKDEKGRYKWNPMKTYSKEKLDRLIASGDAMWTESSKYPVYKKYLDENSGAPLDNNWNDIAGMGTFSAERTGFITQKPTKLIERCINLSNSLLTLDYFAGSGTTGHAVINLNRDDNQINPGSGKRKYILVEMGNYFDTVTKPRITKVIYSSDWKNGKPTSRDTGISHCFKYIRLESYEDTLNNLVFDDNPTRSKTVESNSSLKEDYMLHYLLDVETRGSQSLLNIDGFTDTTSYTLNVKKPGSDEQVTRTIDLIETFNYLLGLRLENMAAPQTFTANFIRKPDPELPEDQYTKLEVDGKIQLADDGKWWFRKVEGWVPADSMNPNNGIKERILIVWRKLTGNLEEDNLMLDEWFEKYRISTRDFEYDTIYVNGSNNLPNLRKDDENWKVRLIEEEFHKRMWETGGEA